MKILHITAGAAGMYCGSCLRDNALAAELIARGHDVMLVPLYTPTLTDEENVSQDKVFFGGISVYLEQHSALFRKTPWLIDRLWDSKLALKLASRSSIQVEPTRLADLTVSMLKGEDGNQRKELRKLIHWLKSETPPDVVNIPNSLLISLAVPIKKALGVPVVCTLQGEDLFLEGLPEPHRSTAIELIKSKVEAVDAFLAVSEYYVEHMARLLDIPENKIHVVPLGINLDGYTAEPRSRGEEFKIGYFARVAPEKGLHVLCDAYRRLRQQGKLSNASLEVAGYLAPEHRAYLSGIEQQMKSWGLGDEFRYLGVVDRKQKIDFLKSLDVLSVPTTYDEPKGIFLLEAMACGVPVVQPRRGTFTEIVEKTMGGLLVEPDDPERLAEGLYHIFENPHAAEEMGLTGAERVRRFYNVGQMAERTIEVYGSLNKQPSQKRAEAAAIEMA
ncbi:MAG TPA: glycosyltransferase family 4 protein [Blastocatellia bacterium]|nr:glycosyltransferase family 4 protein [Blastocatellia bacterium]